MGGFRATVLLDISTLSASLIATPARTLTPSVQLMALGLHIPPVRATCERPRMVVMVAQDLLGRKGTGLPRQSWPQTLCQIGECQRLSATQRGERLCLHLLGTSTLDLSRRNRLNEKTKDFVQLQKTTSRSPPAPVKRKPIVSTFRQPGGGSLLASNRRPEPSSRQPVQARQPDSRQPETIVTAAPPAGPTLSLFDRIKARVRGSSTAPTQSPRERAPSLFAEPSPTRARPVATPAPYQANSRFGAFDEVRLAVPGQQHHPNSGQAFSAVPRGSSSPGAAQPYGQPQPYGEFQTVSLQG